MDSDRDNTSTDNTSTAPGQELESAGQVAQLAAPTIDDSEATLNQAQLDVLTLLGSVDRPRFEPELAAELRETLEEAVGPMLADRDPVFLSKHQLGQLHGCNARYLAETTTTFEWSLATAKGVIAHKAIELAIPQRDTPPPLTLVEQAIERLENSERYLASYLNTLTIAEKADLAAAANDFVAAFAETFPPLKKEWKPRPEARIKTHLCGDRLTLAGKIDLSLGYARGQQAGKVLIDFKTGQPQAYHTEDLRFYALVETLRLGVPPRLIVNYYLHAASPRTEVVTEDVLWAALNRVVDGLEKMFKLEHLDAQSAPKQPGPACKWCVFLSSCDSAEVDLDYSEVD